MIRVHSHPPHHAPPPVCCCCHFLVFLLPLLCCCCRQVLEYLWLLNSHHEWVYKHMHGDKDTFLLAFSMAGRREQFTQVSIVDRCRRGRIAGTAYRVFVRLGCS